MERPDNSKGFYLLHRGWQRHDVFGEDPFSRRDAFVWLIERAAYKDTVTDGGVALKRGELCASYRQMAAEWGWSLGAVQRFIGKLKAEKMADTRTDTRAGTPVDTPRLIITICNYREYQNSQRAADTPVDTPSDTRTDTCIKKEKESKGSEEPDGSSAAEAAEPAPDLRRIIFVDLAKWLAEETHQPIARSKSWLGKVAGKYGDGNLIDAATRIRAGPFQNDYIGAITKELQRITGNGRHQSRTPSPHRELSDAFDRAAALLSGQPEGDDFEPPSAFLRG